MRTRPQKTQPYTCGEISNPGAVTLEFSVEHTFSQAIITLPGPLSILFLMRGPILQYISAVSNLECTW